ncbi:testis development-related protein-like [Carassius carassius]|uniref:testis development-related protein-like n=1 Tax=Carassius carassius TaxID=217509 RepID=UPI00286846E0|nr:testis development-related protein-like [Carassius carassius]
MFKKSKSKVLVDEASEEEEDVSWHHDHARKDKDSEGTEEVLSPSTKDSKLKKVKSKREKGDKKLFPSQDDEHILLTGVTVSHRRGSAKKNWEDDKSKVHPEKDKAHCLWDSITMTMKQITPTKKIDKIEGWEPPQLNDGMEEENNEPEKKRSDSTPLSSPLTLSLPHSLGLPSWVGLGSEEDSSRYASLTESQTGGPAQWAARARDKLAAVRRRSPASLSENNWEGLK